VHVAVCFKPESNDWLPVFRGAGLPAAPQVRGGGGGEEEVVEEEDEEEEEGEKEGGKGEGEE